MIKGRLANILMAEDDPADQLLVKKAFQASRLANPLHLVNNGSELLNYLRGEGDYQDREQYPFPDAILLDLDMPVMDGRAALHELNKDPELSRIPVIVMTVSRDEADVFMSYNEGAASFITKPLDLEGLTNAFRVIEDHWVSIIVPFETEPQDSGSANPQIAPQPH